MRELTINDIEWTIEALPEDASIEGNCMASGDEELDQQCADKIREELEWNEWAWCTVRVTGQWEGIEADSYLGCCSYSSREDFVENSGYCDDMKREVLAEIQKQAERIALGMNK